MKLLSWTPVLVVFRCDVRFKGGMFTFASLVTSRGRAAAALKGSACASGGMARQAEDAGPHGADHDTAEPGADQQEAIWGEIQ
jgi:hypothetical protein